MYNISIRKATRNDFENIYSLILNEHDNKNNVKEDWKNLFENHWCKPDDFFGYVLIDNEIIIGFLGTVFSYRMINNKLYKFCNLTTWVVNKEYRHSSIQLLFKVLKLKNIVFTAFTPSITAGAIYRALGFKEIENELIIIPFFLSLKSIFHKCIIEYREKIINEYLDKKEKIFFKDHLYYNCIYLLIKSFDGYCLIIGTRSKIKHIPFARIHYISNLTLFQSYHSLVCLNVSLKFKVYGLIVEGRYLQNCKVSKLSIHRKLPFPTMYKSDLNEILEIDTLYSEFFLLNI